MQHPEQQRHRGPGSPPADAPARPCCSPRTPLGGRSWRGATSGVRGCPGAASEDCEKPLAKVSQGFFVIRDASLAVLPDRPPFTPSPSVNRRPPSIDDRPCDSAENVTSAAFSVTSDASVVITEAGTASARIGRVTLAPRSARARPPHVRCGAGGATTRPRKDPRPTDGGRRGRPRAPERRCYRFGTTASK